jgi:primary-amine oxidase
MLASSKVLLALSSLAVFAAFALILTTYFSIEINATPSTAASTNESPFRAPKTNIWAELDKSEVADLYDFLFNGNNQLNLTRHPADPALENHIALLEILQPNKTEVTPYIDGSSPAPARWARLAVAQGASFEPILANYMVGPLPVSNNTNILPLEYCFNSGNRHSIKNPAPNAYAVGDRANLVAINISDITQDLLGARLDGSIDETNPQGSHRRWRHDHVDADLQDR